eukprot:scaffold115211_cov41-Attheya_sp.AAC.2
MATFVSQLSHAGSNFETGSKAANREALAAEPVLLGNGVEWYDLADGLDNDSKKVHGLLTRKDSRGLIDAVIRNANIHVDQSWPTMSFIIGSPGIGKTRALAFALRQMLQNENVNVQYFLQKEFSAILFLRRNGKTYAYKSGRGVPEIAYGDLFSDFFTDRLRTYILLDPSENGAKFAHPTRAQLIVACSTNSKHYHNIEKEAEALIFFLGLPSTKEIEIMALKLNPELNHKLLLKRISDVGPVPRYLFRDHDCFESRKKDIIDKGAISEIDEAVVLKALTDGTAVSNNPSICGALFAHVNVETTAADGVKSTNYQLQRVSVLSQYAAWLLYKRFRGAFVQATINGQGCDTTAMFEKFCAFDLIIGGNFKVANMKLATRPTKVKHIPPAASVIRVMPSRNQTDTRDLFVKPALLGVSSISTDYEVSESYEPPPKKMKLGSPFIVLSDGFSAIDFLNTNRQVFQTTVGADHDMKGWVDLLLDATILKLENNGKLTINAKSEPLEFYWVVPNGKAGWATRRPKTTIKTDIPKKHLNQKDVIDQAIAKHVCQFVLFIKKVQPRNSEFWSKVVPLQGGGDNCILM